MRPVQIHVAELVVETAGLGVRDGGIGGLDTLGPAVLAALRHNPDVAPYLPEGATATTDTHEVDR